MTKQGSYHTNVSFFKDNLRHLATCLCKSQESIILRGLKSQIFELVSPLRVCPSCVLLCSAAHNHPHTGATVKLHRRCHSLRNLGAAKPLETEPRRHTIGNEKLLPQRDQWHRKAVHLIGHENAMNFHPHAKSNITQIVAKSTSKLGPEK